MLVAYRHAGEIDQVEQVRVDELGREVEGQHVEVARRAVGVDAEERQARGPHRRLHVGPGRIGALRHRIGPLVQDFIKDLEPLVGEADLVGVGIDQEEGNPSAPRGEAERCPAPCRCSERASPPGPGAVRSAATGQTSSEQHSCLGEDRRRPRRVAATAAHRPARRGAIMSAVKTIGRRRIADSRLLHRAVLGRRVSCWCGAGSPIWARASGPTRPTARTTTPNRGPDGIFFGTYVPNNHVAVRPAELGHHRRDRTLRGVVPHLECRARRRRDRARRVVGVEADRADRGDHARGARHRLAGPPRAHPASTGLRPRDVRGRGDAHRRGACQRRRRRPATSCCSRSARSSGSGRCRCSRSPRSRQAGVLLWNKRCASER